MAFNAMIISACSSAMAAMDYIARHHKAKLDRVRDYMRFNGVPSELSHTIMEYYKYICLNSQTQDDLKDFVDLPQQLHFKLAIALHRELITRCPLFVEFDTDCSGDLSTRELRGALARALAAQCPEEAQRFRPEG